MVITTMMTKMRMTMMTTTTLKWCWCFLFLFTYEFLICCHASIRKLPTACSINLLRLHSIIMYYNYMVFTGHFNNLSRHKVVTHEMTIFPIVDTSLVSSTQQTSTSTSTRTSTMVHSDSGWSRGVQVELWDPLRTRAIPERLRGVITTRRYTNPRLPLPYRTSGPSTSTSTSTQHSSTSTSTST